MLNEIIPYMEMCRREGTSLQRGMNFGLAETHSVILMSVRAGAPYEDRWSDDGTTLIYEGHDESNISGGPDPKTIDQPQFFPNGRATQNGRFHEAAQKHKTGNRKPERVRVYEKIRTGIWSYNGIFHLVDSWTEQSSDRLVFKFELVAVEGEEDFSQSTQPQPERRRVIPTPVKLEVWKRDAGKCRECGSTDELHFDHILPVAKGGTSLTAENIQLLCARHNLEKSDHIK